MRALITGIGGQDGRLISEILSKEGYEIVGTTRSTEIASKSELELLLPKSVKLISFDVYSFKEWEKLLSTQIFDYIFHLSAQSSVGKSFKKPLENILMPPEACFNMLEATRLYQKDTKVIIAGSTEVFGSHGQSNINERTEKKPMSPYSAGKLSQEAVVSFFRNSYSMWVTNAYLSNHESVYRGHQFVTMKIVKGAYDIINGKSSTIKLGNLSIIRDWGWAPEFMDAIVKLAKIEDPEDIIIATGKSISLFDFASEVFNYFGIQFEEYVEYDASLLRAGDPSEVNYDTSKAELVIKWKASTRGVLVPKKLAQSFQKIASANG